jgi:hypothetical protein
VRPKSKPGLALTSTAQLSPLRHPALDRRFAAEARASALEPQMSRRPSPSPSTAVDRDVVGMNWVWPMAPAQEPIRRARGNSPEAMILRAAISWSSAKSRRRPSAARVAMDRTTSKSPCMAPNPDSMAQMPMTTSRGTP